MVWILKDWTTSELVESITAPKVVVPEDELEMVHPSKPLGAYACLRPIGLGQ